MKRALLVVAAACGHTTRGAPDAITSCAVIPGDRIVVDEINSDANLAFDGHDVAMGFVVKRTDAGPFVNVARLSTSGAKLATAAVPDLNEGPVIASDGTRSIVCYHHGPASTQGSCVAVSHVTDTASSPVTLPFVPTAIAYGPGGFVVATSSQTGSILQPLDASATPIGSPISIDAQNIAITATTTGYAAVSDPLDEHQESLRIDRFDAQLQPLGAPIFITSYTAYPAIAATGEDLVITSVGQPGIDHVVIVHADGASVDTTFDSHQPAIPAASNGRFAVLTHDTDLELVPVSADGQLASPTLVDAEAGQFADERAIVGVPDGFLVARTAPNPTTAGSWDVATFHVACP